MKKAFKRIGYAVGIASLGLFLSGCGDRVTVPPVNVGKVMDTDGYKEGIIPTSTFRLDACWWPGAVCQKLVLLDISDFKKTEHFKLFMPKDKLEMDFTVNLTLAPKPGERDKLFGLLSPMQHGKENYSISNEQGYSTYVQPVVSREARDFMSKFSIMEIANNREAISNKLADRLTEVISKRTPYMAKMVDLAETNYPDIITKAQQKAAERREQIQQVEAEKQINRVRMEKDLELAQKQRKIDVEKAQAEAKVNKILAESMTPAYKEYRMLNALDKMAESDNTKFIPVGMLDSMAAQTMVGTDDMKYDLSKSNLK